MKAIPFGLLLAASATAQSVTERFPIDLTFDLALNTSQQGQPLGADPVSVRTSLPGTPLSGSFDVVVEAHLDGVASISPNFNVWTPNCVFWKMDPTVTWPGLSATAANGLGLGVPLNGSIPNPPLNGGLVTLQDSQVNGPTTPVPHQASPAHDITKLRAGLNWSFEPEVTWCGQGFTTWIAQSIAYATYTIRIQGEYTIAWVPDPLSPTAVCSGSTTTGLEITAGGSSAEVWLMSTNAQPTQFGVWIKGDTFTAPNPAGICLGGSLERLGVVVGGAAIRVPNTFVGQSFVAQLWQRLPSGGSETSPAIQVVL